MEILQTITVPSSVLIPEGKHFTVNQAQKFANWFGGLKKEQFYRDTMNAIFALETLAEIKPFYPDKDEMITAIH